MNTLKSTLRKYGIALVMLSPFLSFGQNEMSPAQEFRQKNEQGAFLDGEWNSPSSFNEGSILKEERDQDLSSSDATLRYMSSENKWEDGHYILEAYAQDPQNKDIWEEVMEYYGIIGDMASVKGMASKIKSSALIPTQVLDFHRVLVSQSDVGAVILSHGEWDTAALQIAADESSKKVKIINIHWLREQTYLDRGLVKLGLNAPVLKSKASDMLKDLITKNPQMKFHLSLSQNKNLLSALSGQLALDGLSFRLNNDGLAASRQISCWEELKIKVPFKMETNNRKVDRFNLNYLPILVSMEDFSIANGNSSDAEWARKWMDELTRRAAVPPVNASKSKKK